MVINKRIFLLDFDGVLCNSMDESLIVSYNTFYKKNCWSIDMIPISHLNFFYKNRWMVRPAGEYYVLWKAFELGVVFNETIFLKMKNEYSKEVDEFQREFYDERSTLKQNLDHWLSLHKTYFNIEEFIHSTEEEIFIVTNKDKESVKVLSKYFGFYDKIKGIYSKEISFNKSILIKKLLDDNVYDTKVNDFLFIDDNIENIKEVGSMNEDILPLLATWGYVGGKEYFDCQRISDMNQYILQK